MLHTCFKAVLAASFLFVFVPAESNAQRIHIPRRQSKPPGPPLAPADAIKKMTVPEGFSVELVAAEPDIVNPVAMTFDEQGRIWITESLEYPRMSAGEGRDRIKVLEDTNGDGTADKVTVFAEGLNIPSGIAVGHGGVWVANAPDILFLQDTDGDGRADKREVVVTGFGRTDTHELPNSLTWGPDGWLYGLNGVFNHSHVKHQGREHRFTCVLFRIHPKTHAFELFAEGTSNPWGVAWDPEGSAFLSACVIDHLWHLAESGYYHRQGGPYPPFTWKLGSIVKHKHQMAAYCGIHYFDSDAYPEPYRDRLYMGNIHGGCINVDKLQRAGSSYFATPEADFLTANDVWFMPVVQKTGPDGCLYILDWYDRYHCYQDARADPKGIDRLKGRLYRVRYQDTPRAKPFNLAKESLEELVERLHSKNVFYRDLAQRVLTERLLADTPDAAIRPRLETLVLSSDAPRKTRLHALWALVGSGELRPEFHQKLFAHDDASFVAWGVRAAGNFGEVTPAIAKQTLALASHEAPDVRLQVAIAAAKLVDVDPMPVWVDVLNHNQGDQVIPHIVWQNLHPRLEQGSDAFLDAIAAAEQTPSQDLIALLPRVLDRVVAVRRGNVAAVARIFRTLVDANQRDSQAARRCLESIAAKVQSRELTGERLAELRVHLDKPLAAIRRGSSNSPLRTPALLIAASWGDAEALSAAATIFEKGKNAQARLAALDAIVAAGQASILEAVAGALASDTNNDAEFRGAVINSLGRLNDPQVARVLLAAWPDLEPELRPRVVELLTGRTDWAKQLLAAVGRKVVPTNALNTNQVRKLLASKDKDLVAAVEAKWGRLRMERNPAREKVIGQMREFLTKTPGDPHQGRVVFRKVCGQCHKIYGQGESVGPEITRNGRGSFDQLLSNVFDPSLVIGADYQARSVITADGRVLTGLLVEDSPQRIVLINQGGKRETIARADVDEIQVSNLSLMPEDLEKQLKPEELADLFAFLVLTAPPDDPQAELIPGTPNVPRKK